jgi:HlyD family secretion protein
MIDPQTRQATVRIDLPESDLLRPGMFLQAAITSQVVPGLTVPAKAVLPQASGSALVYVLAADNTVRAQTVELGARQNTDNPAQARVEIKRGLQAGDRVVVAGAGYLKDGDRVEVVTEPGAPSNSASSSNGDRTPDQP